MARPSNGKTLTLPILLALQKLPHEIRKLLLPPGPIVVHILAPEINPRRHSKPFKLLLQNPCVLFLWKKCHFKRKEPKENGENFCD